VVQPHRKGVFKLNRGLRFLVAVMLVCFLMTAGCQSKTLETEYGEWVIGDIPISEDIEVPSFYEGMRMQGDNLMLYAFTDKSGEIVFRAYAEREVKVGDTISYEKGFIPATFDLVEEGFSLRPDGKNVNIMNDLENVGVAKISIPNENIVPYFYDKVQEGLYSFIDRNGKIQYRVYGGFPDQEEKFWRGNEQGEMVAGTLYVAESDDLYLYGG